MRKLMEAVEQISEDARENVPAYIKNEANDLELSAKELEHAAYLARRGGNDATAGSVDNAVTLIKRAIQILDQAESEFGTSLDENDKDSFVDSLQGNGDIIPSYSDYDPPKGTRNLDIRGEPTTLGTWNRIMTRALADSDGEYNEFNIDNVTKAFVDAIQALGVGEREFQFIPGRESSVVLYVAGEYEKLEDLGNYIHSNRRKFSSVDEIDAYEESRHFSFPVLRLWWD